MIRYDKFFKTLKDKGFSQYRLYTYYNISRNLLQRMHQNQATSTDTLNKLCRILDCKIEDIVEYKFDENETFDFQDNKEE